MVTQENTKHTTACSVSSTSSATFFFGAPPPPPPFCLGGIAEKKKKNEERRKKRQPNLFGICWSLRTHPFSTDARLICKMFTRASSLPKTPPSHRRSHPSHFPPYLMFALFAVFTLFVLFLSRDCSHRSSVAQSNRSRKHTKVHKGPGLLTFEFWTFQRHIFFFRSRTMV